MTKRVSGLNDHQAKHARDLIVKAAGIMVAHKSEIHYSQGADREEGIRNKLTITKGQFPRHADCSSTCQWMLYDAIGRPYGVKDPIGFNWKLSGYTGNHYNHGKRVVHDKNLKIGDRIFYGDQGGGIPEHEAVYIGGGKVFSHGSEGGPYILDMDYRPDRRRDCMRRVI